MKIAVSTYSFQRLINAGGMSQLDCIRQAREMGFDGVEIMELFPPEGMEREEYAGRIASLCRSLDFPVVNYTVSADFLAGSGKNPEAEAIRLQRQVDIAAILGAAGLRHDAAWGIPEGSGFRGFEEALPVLIEGCRRVTDYAASKARSNLTGGRLFHPQQIAIRGEHRIRTALSAFKQFHGLLYPVHMIVLLCFAAL